MPGLFYEATSKNSFSVIWAEDFVPEKVMEKTEYFVYCGFFITHLWDGRFAQSPKGEFLEVPMRKCKIRGLPGRGFCNKKEERKMKKKKIESFDYIVAIIYE